MSGFDLQGLIGGGGGIGGIGGGLGPAASYLEQLRPQKVDDLAKEAGVESPRPLRAGVESPVDFGGALASAIERVDGLQKDVADKVQGLASGEPVALHDIMMSMGKSEVAFNLMLEVRNKLVDAWEKLSRSVV